MVEQPYLAVNLPAIRLAGIAAKAGHTDHTVARHNDGQRVIAAGVADSARAAAQLVSERPVGERLAGRDER